jgi:hypothetical protein
MKINSSLSHRRNLESVLETKAKSIPEKRVMKLNSSLSHRRNLESGSETKGKIIWKRVRDINSSPYLIAAIWNSFRDKGKNYSGKKSDEDILFTVSSLSHRRNLETVLEKKGKISPEKGVMKFSLSHRRNLEQF